MTNLHEKKKSYQIHGYTKNKVISSVQWKSSKETTWSWSHFWSFPYLIIISHPSSIKKPQLKTHILYQNWILLLKISMKLKILQTKLTFKVTICIVSSGLLHGQIFFFCKFVKNLINEKTHSLKRWIFKLMQLRLM